MRIFRHTDHLPPEVRGAVVAIGNFDGLHRGHRAVIGYARALAAEAGAPSAVLTFEPHPRSVFRPDAEPFRLTSLRTKSRHIEALGVDALFVQHFDLPFSRVPAEEFVRRVLVEGIGVRHIVVGEDFAFGHRRRGNVGLLREMAAEHGFDVTATSPIRSEDGTVISSNTIRRCLQEGRPDAAARLLGRPWEVDGRVIHGDARGRALGFPTANIRLGDVLHPKTGVYAVRAGIDRGPDTEWLPGAANFGSRPQFDGDGLLLEVYLFDFSGDLYGQHLRVAFIEYLRGEQAFDGVPALVRQMERDEATARAVLGADAAAAPRG